MSRGMRGGGPCMAGTPEESRRGHRRRADRRGRSAGSRAPSPSAAPAGRPSTSARMSAVGQVLETPPDLGQRQVLGLEPADETQSREVALAVLAARAGLADRRQEPLGEVVADGARRDPGKVGELGQGVAIVVWHGAIIDSRTCHCQYPTADRHAASIPAPHPAASIVAQGSAVDPTNGQGVPHIMPRVFAAILLVVVLVVGGGIIATTAYQAGLSTAVTTATTGGADGRRARRRPRLRLRLGLGLAPVVRDLRLLRRPVLPVPRLRPDPGDLLARRARASWWLGPRRLVAPATAPRQRVALGGARPRRRSTTGTAARTIRRLRRPTRAPPDRADRRLTAPPFPLPRALGRDVRGRIRIYDERR